jgi:hypothetical protein
MAAAVTMRTAQPTLDTTKSTQVVRGSIALTGSYPAGGDTINLSGFPTQSAQVPVVVWFTETPTSTGTVPSGYEFYYQPGTNPSNGKLRIMNGTTGEFATGAYNAALLAALITFEAIFPLGM